MIAELLGEAVVSESVTQKRQEIADFYDRTTRWERDQYVELL